MPMTRGYRRYRTRRKRTFATGGIRKGFRGSRFVSRRTSMTTGKVKRIIDAEMKFRDLSVGPVDMPIVGGAIFHLSNIAQGDTNTQRNGNWIKPVSFMGTITVSGNPASGDLVSKYRVGVMYWKENQDVDPAAIAKIFQDVGDPHQQFNIQNKGQYKILWNRTGQVVNNTDNSQFVKLHRFYVRPPMKVLYDDDTFKKNHLFIFGLSDVDIANGPPQLVFSIRIRYTDS